MEADRGKGLVLREWKYISWIETFFPDKIKTLYKIIYAEFKCDNN